MSKEIEKQIDGLLDEQRPEGSEREEVVAGLQGWVKEVTSELVNSIIWALAMDPELKATLQREINREGYEQRRSRRQAERE